MPPHAEDILISRLDNGLTVIIQLLDYAPVVSTTVAYRVGSIDERAGTRGLSHFSEHMMFKGTPMFGPGSYWNIVQRNGGRANAFTSKDLTVYYSTVPVTGLQDILELEADRMMNCLMDPAEVASERQVILEEQLLTTRDNPDGALSTALFREAFRVHPYGHPIIGTPEDIRAFEPESLSAFYRRFYRPSNAVLSVVGQVDPAKVLRTVRELFDHLPAEEPIRDPVPVEPVSGSAAEVELDHPSPMPRCSLAFHVPGADHRDSSALSLLAIHLSAGRSSRFEETLVNPGLVQDISTSTNSLMDPGLFTIHTVLRRPDQAERMLEEVRSEILAISENGLGDDRLRDMKGRRSAWSRISDTDPSGRSRRFAAGEILHGDHLSHWRSTAAACEVDNDDVIRVAREHLVSERSVLAVLKPEAPGSGTPSATESHCVENDDLSPPNLIVPDDTKVPQRLLRTPEHSVSQGTEERVLDNGMRLLLKRDTSFPVASIAFSVPMGTSREPEELAGISGVVAETMLYGTKEDDSIEFNRRVESLGSGLEFSPLNEFAAGGLTVLGADTGSALTAVSELLMRPALRRKDLDQVKREALAGLEEWCASPIGAAMNSFARLSTDPSRGASVPSRESISSIGREDLTLLFNGCCRPDGAVLSVVGDFPEETVGGMIEDLFGDWRIPDVPAAEVYERKNTVDSRSRTIPLEGRNQVAVVLGGCAPPRKDPDTHAFSIINGILGEGIGSRLGRTIRDSAGLCYHVSSAYLPFIDRGRIVALLMTSPGVYRRAVTMLEDQLTGLSSGEFSPNELRLELASHIGRLQIASTSYGSMARTLMTFASLDLPLDYDSVSTGIMLDLAPEDLSKAAQRWLGDGIRYSAIAGAVEQEDGDAE